MNIWAANCRLQAAFGASRQPLASLRQLLGTPRTSIPALRKPNGGPRQRHLASRTANWSIEKASSKVKTALSSCHSAWSRSRRRRGRRPHEVFGFASNVLIIDGELRKTFGQCSTLKRASRFLAKTGSCGLSNSCCKIGSKFNASCPHQAKD